MKRSEFIDLINSPYGYYTSELVDVINSLYLWEYEEFEDVITDSSLSDEINFDLENCGWHWTDIRDSLNEIDTDQEVYRKGSYFEYDVISDDDLIEYILSIADRECLWEEEDEEINEVVDEGTVEDVFSHNHAEEIIIEEDFDAEGLFKICYDEIKVLE